MRLDRVHIQNYRSIADLSLGFDVGCQVLIGINESGKSNILRALQLLDPASVVNHADLRLDRKEEKPVTGGHVRFVFELDEDEVQTVFDSVSTHFDGPSLTRSLCTVDGENLALKEFCRRRNEGLHTISIPDGKRSSTSWAVSPVLYKSTGQWRRSTLDSSVVITRGDGESTTIPAKGFVEISDVATGLEQVKLENATTADVNSLIGREIIKIVTEKLPKCIFWKYSDQYLLPSSIDINSFCANPDTCIPLRSMFELAGYPAKQLSATILAARTQSQHRYFQVLQKASDAATKHIRQVWKDHKSVRISLQPNGDLLIPLIIDDEVPLDMASRSDGFKRFVSFLLQVSAKVRTEELKGVLLLVDEPEIALHPGGARSLMKELVEIGETNSVVYSTHSIFMIDRDRIDRHLVVEKKNEVTITWRAEESRIQDEEVLYGAIGYSIFETLKEKNIIFEGWRDKEVFRIARDAMSKSHKEMKAGLSAIGLTFADGVKDVKHVARFLELASRPCLIISDADAPALEKKREYEKVGAWGKWLTLKDVLGPSVVMVTAEDLIIKESIIKRANKFRSDIGGLAELKSSDFLPAEVVLTSLNRWLRTAGLTGEELGIATSNLKNALFSNLKREDLAEQVDDLVRFVFEYKF